MILTHLVFYDFLGGASESAAGPVVSTYAANWMSPSMRLGILLLMLWRV